MLDLCYALGKEGVMTITDGHKCQRGISEGESLPYMRGRRISTIVVEVASPSFPCARQFVVMQSGTKGGVITITDGRKISEGVCPPYMREEESRLLLWGSFLLLLLVLDLC